MVRIYLFQIISFFLICSLPALGQEAQQINAKKKELSDLKSQINDLEDQLKQKSAKEKQNYSVIENYSKQSFLLNQLIGKLNDEEQEKTKQINSTQQEITNLENEIKEIKENYAKYVIAIYKYGKVSELQSLLEAKSVEQALLRYKYLQKFSEKREEDIAGLNDKKDQLISAKKRLISERKEKQVLTAQKQDEEKSLESKTVEKKRVIASIRKDKSELKNEIEAKKDAESKIKNLISQLIEEAERKRKEAERLAKLKAEAEKNSKINNETKIASVNPTYDVDLSTSGFSSFSALKGKLNWPVSSGKIVHKFGENLNSHLNTVTLNYGVDIKTNPDANVKAVADGVVSTINWLPGYGSVVIVTHKNEYRTVYSHLGEIFVKEGEKLKMGSAIGKVGESLEGNILHFEIWNARKNQDPETWLAGK